MTIYKQRQVLLVPVPFTDQNVEKPRPAVVLSSQAFNAAYNLCIIAAITSSIPTQLENDEVLIKGLELAQAGLPKVSIVKSGTLFTISNHKILRQMGELTPATFNKVQQCLLHILGTR